MLSKSFLRKISSFISDCRLLEKGDKCLVALSGGADSVALALVLRQLGYQVEAAHCNFHLRGDESDRDEKFCAGFCNSNGVKLHIAHFDTVSFARLRKISIEMAARDLRYSYFSQLKEHTGSAAVCVAHHQDDSVETVLMNLIRGTGIHGLTGISARNGDIVRPLLCVSRCDIETELGRAGQDFVTDSTNLIDDVVRNKIRLDILPLMRKINPSVSVSIAKTAERVGEAARVFDTVIKDTACRAVARDGKGTVRISSDVLRKSPSAEYALFHILKDFSFNPSQIEQISRTFEAEPGRVFCSSSHRLLVDRDFMIIEPLIDDRLCRIVIPEEGVYVCGNSVRFKVERTGRTVGTEDMKARDCLYADSSKVCFPLVVRNVVAGDRFVPFGMRGSKLVSDYLTDRKVSLFDKQRQLVVEDAVGHIIWLVNQRSDERYRITDKTEAILKITCLDF